MNYKEFNHSLPIKDNHVLIIDGIIQGDTANIINLRLMDGTETFDFTGYTEVFIEILKPDGTTIQACATDDPDINNDNNPYTIEIVNPADGRISFTLHGQATCLSGTHFAQVSIMSGGKKLTSPRFNYYVGDTLDLDATGITSAAEYASLQTLIARNSSIAEAERDRTDTETLRRVAEIDRETRVGALEASVQAYLDTADSYVNQTEEFKALAYQYAQLAQNPSAEIMAGLISDMDLASETYVTNAIATATHDFDAGAFTDEGTDVKLLNVRRGLLSEMISLTQGEFGYATDTEQIFVGGANGNVPIGGAYIASAIEPDRTDILWVDTSAGGAIKYHNGTAWVATATATFA